MEMDSDFIVTDSQIYVSVDWWSFGATILAVLGLLALIVIVLLAIQSQRRREKH
jgi:hypothetical protein